MRVRLTDHCKVYPDDVVVVFVVVVDVIVFAVVVDLENLFAVARMYDQKLRRQKLESPVNKITF